jgi:hypothetical protein
MTPHQPLLSPEAKRCYGCNETKPQGAYARNRRRPDGRQALCRDCVKKHYEANRDPIRQHQRNTWSTYAEANRQRLREKDRARRAANPGGDAAYRLTYKELYAPKIAAGNAIRSQILTGRVAKQPCEVCGDEKADAHHDDYAKPLDVRWLCRKHHRQWHAKHGSAPNGTTARTE